MWVMKVLGWDVDYIAVGLLWILHLRSRCASDIFSFRGATLSLLTADKELRFCDRKIPSPPLRRFVSWPSPSLILPLATSVSSLRIRCLLQWRRLLRHLQRSFLHLMCNYRKSSIVWLGYVKHRIRYGPMLLGVFANMILYGVRMMTSWDNGRDWRSFLDSSSSGTSAMCLWNPTLI